MNFYYITKVIKVIKSIFRTFVAALTRATSATLRSATRATAGASDRRSVGARLPQTASRPLGPRTPHRNH